MATEAPEAPEAPVADAPKEKKDPNRLYGVFVKQEIDLTNPNALEALQKFADEGKVKVLVQAGQVLATDPRKSLANLGAIKELDDTYQVIADSSITEFKDVKTTAKVTVKIG